jgi:hypothetical protein
VTRQTAVTWEASVRIGSARGWWRASSPDDDIVDGQCKSSGSIVTGQGEGSFISRRMISRPRLQAIFASFRSFPGIHQPIQCLYILRPTRVISSAYTAQRSFHWTPRNMVKSEEDVVKEFNGGSQARSTILDHDGTDT